MKKFFFIFSICLLGCIAEPTIETPPSPLLSLPVKKEKQENKSFQAKEEPIVFFMAPDQSGALKKDHSHSDLAIKSVKMKIIGKWEDTSSYHVAVQFINKSNDSVTGNLNLYAYDRTGKLVRTEFTGTIGFRPRSIYTRQYCFTKASREVRWILSLTGKQ